MPEASLPKGQKVRFTEVSLARGPEGFRKRFAGRVGEVSGYRLGATRPIVVFPKEGRRIEQKLFEVDPRDLELVKE